MVGELLKPPDTTSGDKWFLLNLEVPQIWCTTGSLFLRYVNDMPNVISESKIAMFADDSKCFKVIRNNEDFDGIQFDLYALCL
jgi:hypothetical protein